MSDPLNVLFLSTGDSARSNMAESILTFMSGGRFRAFSAGIRHGGQVNAIAIRLLQQNKMPIDGLHIRKWDEFAKAGAPPMDFIITFRDKTERRKPVLWRGQSEDSPAWPGQPVEAQWNIEDPEMDRETEDEEVKMRAFKKAFIEINTRISLFTSLPLEKLDRQELQRKLNDIGMLDNSKEAMFKDLQEENVVLSNKLDKANHEIARLNRIISQISHKPQQYQGGFH